MAASSTPRRSSREDDRRRPCSTAFANVNVCSAVSQSPNSLLVGNRAIRVAAAKVTDEASSTAPAPSSSAASSASRISAASPPSRISTSSFRPPHSPEGRGAGSRSNASSSSATRSTGLRHAFDSSIRSALASCDGSEASTASACSQPAVSSASRALLTKSSV